MPPHSHAPASHLVKRSLPNIVLCVHALSVKYKYLPMYKEITPKLVMKTLPFEHFLTHICQITGEHLTPWNIQFL